MGYAVCATEGGVYFSTDQLTTWTQKNSGLTGEALKVRKLSGLGSLVMIATRNGLYYSADLDECRSDGATRHSDIPHHSFAWMMLTFMRQAG